MILILVILVAVVVTIVKMIFKSMWLVCGTACTIFGALGTFASISIMCRNQHFVKIDAPMHLILSIVTLAFGIFLFYRYRKFTKKSTNSETEDTNSETEDTNFP